MAQFEFEFQEIFQKPNVKLHQLFFLARLIPDLPIRILTEKEGEAKPATSTWVVISREENGFLGISADPLILSVID